jgi:hypothetical protein
MTDNQAALQKSELFRQLSNAFKIGAGLGILFGLIHFASIISSGFTTIRLTDALINASAGVVALVCLRLLTQGKLLIIPICMVAVAGSIVYSLAVGRGFNIVITVVGVVLVGALIMLQQRGELK